VSEVTVSKVRNRTYQRQFDHDEARALKAEGWSYTELGKRFGVSDTAVRRVCDPKLRDDMNARSIEWMRQNARAECKGGCGKLVWAMKGRSGYCARCTARRSTAADVRPDALRCTKCREWKPDALFPKAGTWTSRRGRKSRCRACETARRRASRQRGGP
jgi:hypothetical protein